MKPQIKALLFDLGNVLLMFDARKSAQAFSEALGVTQEKLWEAFFISDFEKAYTRGEISSQEFFKRASKHFSNNKIDFDTFAHLWNDIFSEHPGISDLLAQLKKKYPLYLISNTNELHFEHIKKKFDVLKYFSKCYPSHEVGHRKPDPRMFEHVLKDIKFKPEETVFVDDIMDFVEGAKKVGIHGIQFKSVEQLRQDLKGLGIEF
jgi:glucose-1-phosphatase